MAISIYANSFDALDSAAIAGFWAQALGRNVNPGATNEVASVAPREGSDQTPILFHGVPEAKTVKNRLHLYLITGDFDTELARLQALGATEVATFARWTTLSDPEGNEFDLIRA
jgi:predicted enzyme related to lactoylglutathione lyase